MHFDIVLVTYNSEKWIDNCFASIAKSSYPLDRIHIYIVDNGSSDGTLRTLSKAKKDYEGVFGDFSVLASKENLGFGRGNNYGFEQGSSPYVLFLNIDTEIDEDALNEMKLSIEKSESAFAMWELRQFPYSHPKIEDPVTLETTWSSGAAFAASREVFKKVSGFDKNIFMYAEDVDLSWRIRALGYKIKVVPGAIVNHYCYKNAGEIKPTQYFNSIINNLLLRYRFGSLTDILKGKFLIYKILTHHTPIKKGRQTLLKLYLKHFLKIHKFLKWRFANKIDRQNFKPQFYGFDYETVRHGAFYKNEKPDKTPLVSILVRTCGRPAVLRETLASLRNQVYKNIEVVIVEDGPNISESMINEEFSDLNILYKYTNQKVGRCKAGNIAMNMANGKYLNFLDDDDLFYADHVEVLVNQLEKNSEYRIAYALAFETPIKVINRNPYIYKIKNYYEVLKQPFNKILLFHHNFIPIQCIMFEKDVFLEEGGFDEKLDVLEDWDLWVRYACKNDFLYIEKITSIYRVPADTKVNNKRQHILDEALSNLRNKHKSYISKVNVEKTAEDIQDIYNSFVVAVTEEKINSMKARRPIITRIALKCFGLARRIVK